MCMTYVAPSSWCRCLALVPPSEPCKAWMNGSTHVIQWTCNGWLLKVFKSLANEACTWTTPIVVNGKRGLRVSFRCQLFDARQFSFFWCLSVFALSSFHIVTRRYWLVGAVSWTLMGTIFVMSVLFFMQMQLFRPTWRTCQPRRFSGPTVSLDLIWHVHVTLTGLTRFGHSPP